MISTEYQRVVSTEYSRMVNMAYKSGDSTEHLAQSVRGEQHRYTLSLAGYSSLAVLRGSQRKSRAGFAPRPGSFHRT